MPRQVVGLVSVFASILLLLCAVGLFARHEGGGGITLVFVALVLLSSAVQVLRMNTRR